MMRRVLLNTTTLSTPKVAAVGLALRFGGHGPTVHDHSASFSRALTPEEKIALSDQSHRTVSSVVPGKLFMRHWLAGEQATVSIVNRTLSLFVTLGLFVWASGYSGLGWNSLSAEIGRAHV